MEYRELNLLDSGKYSLVILGDVAIPEEEEGTWLLENGRVHLNSADRDRVLSPLKFRHDEQDYLGIIPSGDIICERVEEGLFYIEALLARLDQLAGEKRFFRPSTAL